MMGNNYRIKKHVVNWLVFLGIVVSPEDAVVAVGVGSGPDPGSSSRSPDPHAATSNNAKSATSAIKNLAANPTMGFCPSRMTTSHNTNCVTANMRDQIGDATQVRVARRARQGERGLLGQTVTEL